VRYGRAHSDDGTEEIHALAPFSQMHDPRLGLLELEAHLGQDRGERLKRALQRVRYVGLTRTVGRTSLCGAHRANRLVLLRFDLRSSLCACSPEATDRVLGGY
jgi:hypothetical protein